jgi:predicted house-cleaning noncanonical NTP pyrophosphatase (MazG superfamily)
MPEKLVRNNVPKVVPEKRFRIADDSERLELLRQKLTEEVEEFLEDNSMAELADVLDVVMTLAMEIGSFEELCEISDEKHDWLGGFEDSVVYIWNED